MGGLGFRGLRFGGLGFRGLRFGGFRRSHSDNPGEGGLGFGSLGFGGLGFGGFRLAQLAHAGTASWDQIATGTTVT